MSSQSNSTSPVVSSLRLPAFAVVCAVLWGSAFPAIKSVYSGWETNSLELRLCFAGIRFTLAGLMIFPFCLGQLTSCKPGWARLLLLLALTQTVLQYLFFYSGLAASSGVLGSILVGAGSLWWIVLAPLCLKTPWPRWRHFCVIAVSSLGVMIAVYAPGVGSGAPFLGMILFLMASLSGALAAILVVPLSRLMDVKLATSGALFFGGILLMLGGVREMPRFIASVDVSLAITTVYLAGVSAGAFGLWNWLVREYSVNVLAGYRFLIPLSAVTQSSFFIKDESPGFGIALGGILILGSLIYLHRSEMKAHRSG